MRICSTKWKMDRRIFLDEDLSREWATHHTRELIIGMGDINGHVGRNIDELQGFMEDVVFEKEI